MKYLHQIILASAVLLVGSSQIARAANCASFPYTLTNGQTADANQVMANFNTVRDCGNNNLLSKNNNLSDVQSAGTSRTNLGLGAAAVEGLSNTSAGAVTDDGAGNLVGGVQSLHTQVFTSNGTFTIPAGATSATVFKFTVVGGGGGGGFGGASSGGFGGASGGAAVAYFSGFAAAQSVTIAVGTGGTGGTFGVNGTAGGLSSATFSATAIVSCGGGNFGPNATTGAAVVPGSITVSAGATGLNLVGFSHGGEQPGGVGATLAGSTAMGGTGGGNSVGVGGAGAMSAGSVVGGAGTQGGGGAGGVGSSGNGGAGGTGVVVVEWVL